MHPDKVKHREAIKMSVKMSYDKAAARQHMIQQQ